MKTETQITEENIEKANEKEKLWHDGKRKTYKARINIQRSKEHKASCQRFLGFLEGVGFYSGSFEYHETGLKFDKLVKEKTTDLKQAIKLYEDNGI